jgi:putative YphP/YqiW family bacilliredoxin
MNPLNILRQPASGQQTLYDERFIAPMRQELVDIGFEELRTAADVDARLKDTSSTMLVVVNSMCGCAAGRARPGIALALQHSVRPARLTTVFAGQDREATERARSYFEGHPPSSPSVGLFKGGKLVFMMHRHEIEGRDAPEIAGELVKAFEKYCST